MIFCGACDMLYMPHRGGSSSHELPPEPFVEASGRALDGWTRRFIACSAAFQAHGKTRQEFCTLSQAAKAANVRPAAFAVQAIRLCLACACSPPLSGRRVRGGSLAVAVRPRLVLHYSGGFCRRQGPVNRSPRPPKGGLGKYFCTNFRPNFWTVLRHWGDIGGVYSTHAKKSYTRAKALSSGKSRAERRRSMECGNGGSCALPDAVERITGAGMFCQQKQGAAKGRQAGGMQETQTGGQT